MLLVISLLVGIVVFIVLYLLVQKISQQDKVVKERLHGLGSNKDNPDFYQDEMEKSLSERLFKPLGEKIAKWMRLFTPSNIYSRAEEDVEASGGFFGKGINGYMLMCAGTTAVFLFIAIMYARTPQATFFKTFVAFFLAAIGGLLLPQLFIKGVIKDRRDAIRRAMPDMLDLLCVSVQAGLGFDGALSKVTAKMKGPLVEECEKMLQELRMGVPRRNALMRLGNRCGIQEMKLFTAALIQADRLGVGMAQVLEIQAKNMREMRRAHAKEQAARLPTKILFPTLVFIFPVIFIIVLGPAIVSLSKTLLK